MLFPQHPTKGGTIYFTEDISRFIHNIQTQQTGGHFTKEFDLRGVGRGRGAQSCLLMPSLPTNKTRSTTKITNAALAHCCRMFSQTARRERGKGGGGGGTRLPIAHAIYQTCTSGERVDFLKLDLFRPQDQ